jgi:o-succinylbenzoate---CoA ligase
MSNGLHLNGTYYSPPNLLQFCRDKLADPQTAGWERSMVVFLAEWYNDSDFIEVQTSGSTGDPQTLQVKKKFVEKSARMTLDFLALKPGNIALLCLPANYIAGKMMLVRSILGELNLMAIAPKGNVADQLSSGIDFAAMIPLQVQNLLEHPKGKLWMERIQKLIIGGAPIPPALEKNLRRCIKPIYSTYGMTETVSHIAMRRLDGTGYSNAYTLMPNVSVRQDDNDCLVISAPLLSASEVTTKDVVRILPDDCFEVLGRLDNRITSGGIKYFPENIEKKLNDVLMDRFIVSSKPDPKLGEKIILIIESEQPENYSISYLKRIFGNKLTPYEFPKEVLFLKQFPETETSKLVRKQITSQALNLNL